MNCDGREILLHQQLGQSNAALHCFHKDNHLKQNQKLEHRKSGNREIQYAPSSARDVFLLKNLNEKA